MDIKGDNMDISNCAEFSPRTRLTRSHLRCIAGLL